jgi:UDP-GlcNAc:undecaprenyl-phosphate GlcNAc-1-phosphate transferase
VIAVALGFVVGAGMATLILLAVPDLLRAPALLHSNHRGSHLPTAGGVIVVLSVVLVEGARVGAGALGIGREPGVDGTRGLVLLACVGFGLFGLLDDVLATGEERGFAGHVRALGRGRVTTGLIKLVGGGALALALVSASGPEPRPRLLADAAVIALAANLGNLLDRAPGRSTKVGVIAWIPLLVLAGGDTFAVALAPVMGAFVAVAPADLGERLMLGDAGANILGAVLGLGVVLETGFATRLVVLVVLAALNLVSERVSFSRVIERVTVLRTLDQLGRRR